MSDEKKKLRSPYLTPEEDREATRQAAIYSQERRRRDVAARAEFVKKYGVEGRRTPEQAAAYVEFLKRTDDCVSFDWLDDTSGDGFYEFLADAYVNGTLYTALGDMSSIDFDRVKSIVKARGYDV